MIPQNSDGDSSGANLPDSSSPRVTRRISKGRLEQLYECYTAGASMENSTPVPPEAFQCYPDGPMESIPAPYPTIPAPAPVPNRGRPSIRIVDANGNVHNLNLGAGTPHGFGARPSSDDEEEDEGFWLWVGCILIDVGVTLLVLRCIIYLLCRVGACYTPVVVQMNHPGSIQAPQRGPVVVGQKAQRVVNEFSEGRITFEEMRERLKLAGASRKEWESLGSYLHRADRAMQHRDHKDPGRVVRKAQPKVPTRVEVHKTKVAASKRTRPAEERHATQAALIKRLAEASQETQAAQRKKVTQPGSKAAAAARAKAAAQATGSCSISGNATQSDCENAGGVWTPANGKRRSVRRHLI